MSSKRSVKGAHRSNSDNENDQQKSSSQSNAVSNNSTVLSTQRSLNEAQLLSFLQKHRAKDKDNTTLTGMFGDWEGKYSITKEEDIKEFWDVYARAIASGVKPSLVEMPVKQNLNPLPLLIDLDLSEENGKAYFDEASTWEKAKETHEHTNNQQTCVDCSTLSCDECSYVIEEKVVCFTCYYNVYTHRLWQRNLNIFRFLAVVDEVYRNIRGIAEDQPTRYTVMARSTGYQSKSRWKDGVHIMNKDEPFWMPAILHQDARNKILKVLQENEQVWVNPEKMVYIPKLNISLAWDEQPLSGTGWFLYGSTKPNTEPYDMNFEVCFAGAGEKPCLTLDEEWNFLNDSDSDSDSDESITHLLQQTDGTQETLDKIRYYSKYWSIRNVPQSYSISSFAIPEEPEKAPSVPASSFSTTVLTDAEWADVDYLVKNLLSVERANERGVQKGKEGCVEVIQTLRCVENSPRSFALAGQFARRMNKRAFTSEDDRFVRQYWDSAEPFRTYGSLAYWAREDNPSAYEKWMKEKKQRGPQRQVVSVLGFGKPTADEVKKVVGEVTQLDFTGVKLIADKTGILPFSHRYLFGEGTKSEKAGLTDLNVFVPVDSNTPSTVLIRSHLGTGKTDLFKALANAREATSESMNTRPSLLLPKILYISGRRTFTDSLVAEINQGKDSKNREYFHDYRDKDVPRQLSPQSKYCSRLFVQVESLHRFNREPLESSTKVSSSRSTTIASSSSSSSTQEFSFYDPARDGTYDAIILDEIETILATLKPSTTHKTFLLYNATVFQYLVSSARIVIAGDAFVSQRSLDTLTRLRSGSLSAVPAHPIRLLDNVFQPYARVVQRIRVLSEGEGVKRGGGKHLTLEEKQRLGLKENVPAGLRKWIGRLTKDLQDGKRVVVVMGSKKRGLQIEDQVIKPLFYNQSPSTFNYRYYHADSDPIQKASDLADVETSWAKLSLLMYSPTITVGINYDPKLADGSGPDPARLFDVLYIYGTRGGATPRDLFQASLRVRNLKENRCIYFLDHRGQAPPSIGIKAITKFYEAQAVLQATVMSNVVKRQEKLSKTQQEQGWAMFRPDAHPEVPIPPWFPSLFIRNINEQYVAQGFPVEVYDYYLQRCGYTVEDVLSLDEESIRLNPLAPPRRYDEVVDLSRNQMDELSAHIEAGTKAISDDERSGQVKYTLKARCGLRTEFSWLPADVEGCITVEQAINGWTVPEWATLTNLDLLWRGSFRDPCPANCEEAHRHSFLPKEGNSGFVKHRDKFFQISVEKVTPILAGDALASHLDMCNGCGSSKDHVLLTYKGISLKLRVMRTLLRVLDLSHSCEVKQWTMDEWKNICRLVQEENKAGWDFVPESDDVKVSRWRNSSFLSLAFFAFGLTSQRKEATETTKRELRNETQVLEDISRILEAWSLSTLEHMKEYTEGGVVKQSRQVVANKEEKNWIIIRFTKNNVHFY